MIPITRKERYINQIVGGGDTAPVTPITEEEFFFSDILGEVNAPYPITNIEKYLAKIANKYSGELPEPITRIERFIARAAGMDVTIPTPITREEIFWSNYPVIVDFEVEGVPPLTYKAIEGTLENYRIYGNTVGGESVGNLVESGEHEGEYSVPVTVSNGIDTQTIPIYLPEQMRKFGDYSDYADYEKQKVIKRVGHTVFTSASGWKLEMDHNFYYDIAVSSIIGQLIRTNKVKSVYTRVQQDAVENNCFISGTGKINVWLPEIDSLSEFQDWINEEPFIADYAIENTDLDVTLPALPTLPGTNVLSVGTAVQPSKVYVKYKGERQ